MSNTSKVPFDSRLDVDAIGKVQSLNAYQESMLAEYEQRWIAHGLDCSPMNWKAAMRAVDCAYESEGLTRPKIVVACPSPLALFTGEGCEKIRGRGKFPIPPDRSAVFYGQHNAGWAGFYSYFLEVMGFKEEIESIKPGLIEMCKQGGWYALYEEACYICHKTSAVRTNAAGGLHSLDSMAVEYPDGFGLYAVNDVVIPDEWVPNKGTLDPKIALEWPNVEQRAVAGSIIGWDKVLKHVGARVIDKSPSPYTGTLLGAVLDGVDRRFLEVKCPTGRTMVLSVDPGLQTAESANRWTYPDDDGEPSEGRT